MSEIRILRCKVRFCLLSVALIFLHIPHLEHIVRESFLSVLFQRSVQVASPSGWPRHRLGSNLQGNHEVFYRRRLGRWRSLQFCCLGPGSAGSRRQEALCLRTQLRLSVPFLTSWWTGSSSLPVDLTFMHRNWESVGKVDWNTLSRYFPSFLERFGFWVEVRGQRLDIWRLDKDGGRSGGEPTSAPEEEACAAWTGGPEEGELTTESSPLLFSHHCCFWLVFHWETSRTLAEEFGFSSFKVDFWQHGACVIGSVQQTDHIK